jgi:hypothetical protein
MSPEKPHIPGDKEQSHRFIETARKIGVDGKRRRPIGSTAVAKAAAEAPEAARTKK